MSSIFSSFFFIQFAQKCLNMLKLLQLVLEHFLAISNTLYFSFIFSMPQKCEPFQYY